jgi:AmmeMemoRadiSam system protein B
MGKRVCIVVSIVGAGIAIGVLSAAIPLPSHQISRRSEPVAFPIAFQPNELLTSAFDAKEGWSISTSTRILLMPHHIVPAKEIASLLTSVHRPSAVYYVAPDHFSRGPTGATTLNAIFTNENGSVRTDEVRMRRMQQSLPQLREDEATYRQEPASLKTLPFIAHAWEGIEIVPILVSPTLSTTTRQALVSALVSTLREDPQALVIMSVDFSHYQSLEVSEANDRVAMDAILAEDANASTFLDIDNPAILWTMLTVARTLDLGMVTILAHTNSMQILQTQDIHLATSHVFASFSAGALHPPDAYVRPSAPLPKADPSIEFPSKR